MLLRQKKRRRNVVGRLGLSCKTAQNEWQTRNGKKEGRIGCLGNIRIPLFYARKNILMSDIKCKNPDEEIKNRRYILWIWCCWHDQALLILFNHKLNYVFLLGKLKLLPLSSLHILHFWCCSCIMIISKWLKSLSRGNSSLE